MAIRHSFDIGIRIELDIAAEAFNRNLRYASELLLKKGFARV